MKQFDTTRLRELEAGCFSEVREAARGLQIHELLAAACFALVQVAAYNDEIEERFAHRTRAAGSGDLTHAGELVHEAKAQIEHFASEYFEAELPGPVLPGRPPGRIEMQRIVIEIPEEMRRQIDAQTNADAPHQAGQGGQAPPQG